MRAAGRPFLEIPGPCMVNQRLAGDLGHDKLDTDLRLMLFVDNRLDTWEEV